jgi:hypothetical protein
VTLRGAISAALREANRETSNLWRRELLCSLLAFPTVLLIQYIIRQALHINHIDIWLTVVICIGTFLALNAIAKGLTKPRAVPAAGRSNTQVISDAFGLPSNSEFRGLGEGKR